MRPAFRVVSDYPVAWLHADQFSLGNNRIQVLKSPIKPVIGKGVDQLPERLRVSEQLEQISIELNIRNIFRNVTRASRGCNSIEDRLPARYGKEMPKLASLLVSLPLR